MRIGIIGAGSIGATLGRLLTQVGHDVAIANSRGPETLADLVNDVPGLRALDAEHAAAFGEVAIEAIPYGRYKELPAEQLAGRIVVSASNYYPGRDGEIDLDGRVDTELVAEHLVGSRVVKAFNTIYWEDLRNQGDTSAPRSDRRAIFVAGDDADAKAVVAEIVEGLGFGAVDTGSLHEGGRIQQVGAPIYGARLTVAQAEERLGR